MTSTAEAVICGAGIAGVATAYQLAVTHGVKHVVMVDERPPLTLTSDKSSEAYRNWWPDAAMTRLMNRSIDWLERWAEASGNRFLLNRRGYVYVTARPEGVLEFQQAARAAAQAGAGEARVHVDHSTADQYAPPAAHDYLDQPTGADVVLARPLILDRFPELNPEVTALIHARRCGWFSGQQLGMYLLEEARAHGVTLIDDRVAEIVRRSNRVEEVRLASGAAISTRTFINAAGPFARTIGQLLDVELPLINELHLKVALKDYLNVVPRTAPLMIWTDSQYLPWTDEERAELAASDETRWLLDELPGGAHLRPEGGGASNMVLLLWAYHLEPREPVVPPALDEFFPEVALRGLSAMYPGLSAYFGRASFALYDGGYYTRTPENRPLAGPLPVEGAYVCGGLSGFGLMAAAAVGELVAAHVTGSALPPDAALFSPARYADAAYQQWLETTNSDGQL
jgi:glycine/D-amino acid oxidase-like deaminating enzyme